MPPPDQVSTVYAVDESVVVRAAGDFPTLVPAWQYLAGATDGVFSAGSPWVLNSASSSFITAGIKAGHVCWLRKPIANFSGSGKLFAVESATATSLTLRHVHRSSGVGLPPAPSSGITGVDFAIPSLDQQIEEASFELNRRYSIDPLIPGRSPGNVYDLRDLRQACVLLAILMRLDAEVQQDGQWQIKRKQYAADLDQTLMRIQLRWGPIGTDQGPTNLWSTKIIR